MAKPTPPPFAGRQPTRAERRAAEARYQKRLARRAAAQPPPDPTTRIGDPLAPAPARPAAGSARWPQQDASAAPTATPMHGGAPAAGAVPDPSTISGRAARRAIAATSNAGTQPVGPQAPAARPLPKPGRPSGAARTSSSPRPARSGRGPRSSSGSSSSAPRGGRVRSALTAPWPGAAGQVGFAAGVLGVVVAVGAAVVLGLPVLGHDWNFPALGYAGAGLAVSVFAVLRGGGAVRASRAWVHHSALGVMALLCGALVVGALTNPVVIDGKVHLATSDTARAHRLAMDIRDDLYRVSEFDRLAAYGQEDARAHVDAYAPAFSELVEMNSHYAQLQQDAPTERFAEAINQLRVAAHWEAKALETKSKLITETDERLIADVQSYRNTAWTASLTAANLLEAAASEFSFTISTEQTGPHE